MPLRKITGESFGKKGRYDKSQLRQQVKTWRKSWASLTNRHLKRYGHKAKIDERSLRAQGIKRTPTRHRGPQPKTMRVMLDALRDKQPPLPIAPIIRTTKQTSKDGTITVRAVIKNSALNKIGTNNKTFAPPLRGQPRKGWPPAAIAAWNSWGHKNPALFFRVWAELIEGNVTAGGPTL